MGRREADAILGNHDVHPNDWEDVGDYKSHAYSMIALYTTDQDKNITRGDVFANNLFMELNEFNKFEKSLEDFWKECKE